MTRRVLRLSGPDRETFLHGLITRDVPAEGLGYAALLTPQGKYLADFLTFRDDDALFLDVAAELSAGLAQRLGLYRLRAKVEIEETDLVPSRSVTARPGTLHDPRPGMGWLSYDGAPEAAVDWDAVRVEHMVPASGIELIPNETFVLEMGFERLGGVDFKKGCFVGQEIVARMKHKTELRKGLARVAFDGTVAPGTEITSNGKPAGTVHTVAGTRALAYLRFDRAEGMEAGGVPLTLDARP
ncbi:MAG: folate-binding protein [Pseudomonadota bacterium]